jgi:magnesium transporter
MPKKKYLDYLMNPFELIRNKRILQVNPTIPPVRKETADVRVFLYEYDENTCDFNELNNIEDSFKHLHTPQISWINIDGIKKESVEKICAHFGVHQLIIEDILSIGQRPKTDEINGLLFCVLNMLYFNEKDSSVETEQISILLGKDFVISFQEDASRDVFNQLRDKLKINGSKVRQNRADFLFYMLIDSIVDHYFLVMERLGNRIEELEEDIVRQANKRALAKINILRKEMIVLKRSIGPVRELVNGILRSESTLVDERTEKYFKDVYDHITQANDLADNYRDMLINLQDLYMSNVNLKTNEVMKVMAVVTCLLAPATVIGGIFGMNFERIPLLHNPLGFFISVGLMFTIPAGMIVYFKKKGWF